MKISRHAVHRDLFDALPIPPETFRLPLDVASDQLTGPGARPFTFYLGTHHAADLATAPVPLFLSRRALVLSPAPQGSTAATWHRHDRQRKTLPRALKPWRLDSAGFTELHLFGEHHISPYQYAEEVCRYQEEIGLLDAAFVQDWMVEPEVLSITKQDIETHQRRSVASLLLLRTIAPRAPWAPVLQGWVRGDHERHLAMYYANGIDLRCEPVVGIGSVCRRQGMVEADTIVRDLSGCDLRLHVLGYKFTGLPQVLHYVDSADSMAWSFDARERHVRLPGHDHSSATGSEQWISANADAWIRRRRETGWEVVVAGSAPSRVRDKDAGRAFLRAHGFTFGRESWTCQNCIEYGMEWRRTMLAKVFLSADRNILSRTYGLRDPTREDFADAAEYDEAEGYEMEDRGDFEIARAHLSAMSGVEIPVTPKCHFVRDQTSLCISARYEPPDAVRRTYPAFVEMPVRNLPLHRVGVRDRVRFQPWTPALRLAAGVASTAIKRAKQREAPDFEAARMKGEFVGTKIVKEVDDPTFWEGRNAEESYAIALNQLNDVLPLESTHVEMMSIIRAWGATIEGTGLRAAYRDGLLDAVWAAARREHPRQKTTRQRRGDSWEPQ